MANINLLPWREARRQQIQKQFLVVLGGVVVLAVLMVMLAMSIVNGAISNQEGRNNYLQGHIRTINKEVAEIQDLETRRQQLLDRMNIIQSLQGTRPLIVRVFDEMVRTLPDGLFFTSVVRSGDRIDVEGIAESNLTAVKAAEQYGEQASNFKLSFRISAPSPESEK